MVDFGRRLRQEQYDFVIDSQGLIKSALIAAASRGVRHGFDASSSREPLASRTYDVVHHVSRQIHAVDRNRKLSALALGMESADLCDYGLTPPVELPLVLRKPYCVLLSMSSRAEKLWPEHHWTELVGSLSASGFECILPWGNDVERARCQRIADRANEGMVPRALSLGELAALMGGARAVVGVDTGLTHLAAALDVPALGLFVGSDPALTGLHGSGKLMNLGGPGTVPTMDETLNALASIA